MLAKSKVVILVLMAALVVMIGCGGKEKAPYKIGAVFAITGPASWLGEPEANTAKMIAEEINAAGGINGHPLQLIVEDTAGEEAKTVNAVNRLITVENVAAIIGPSRSGTSLAVVSIVEEKEVPLISCAAAEAIVTDPETGKERKWTFKTPQKDSHAAIRIFEHMKSKGYTNVALISGTTGFGAQGRTQLQRYAGEMGFTIVADETYGPGDTDMTAQLTNIKGKDAQALVNWSIVAAQSIVPQNMKQLGMTTQLYQSHGFGNVQYAQAAGAAGDGLIFPAGRLLVAEDLPDGHVQKDVLVKYKTDYETKFNDDVSTFGGHAYDAMQLVIKALRESSSEADKKAKGDEDLTQVLRPMVRDAIENTKGFVGTGGVFNFSPDDHTGLTKEAFEMLTVKDMKFALLKD
jgi:branched-chain amino acid transport system substrate-binding protein